jgi:hypothetical protein
MIEFSMGLQRSHDHLENFGAWQICKALENFGKFQEWKISTRIPDPVALG